jgi:hypothetical protein
VAIYDGTTFLGSATVTNTTWSYSATVTNATTYTLNAKETDVVGNVSAATANYTITGDTVAPIVSATTATIKNTAHATIESTEISTAYLVKDSVIVTDIASITSAADTSWNQATIPVANTPTSLAATGLVDGIYQVYAVDTAGNLSVEPATNNVTIDTTAPIAANSAAIVFIASDKLRITFAEPISTAFAITDISANNSHNFGTSPLLALNAMGGFASSFDITLSGSTVATADVLSVAITKALDLAGNSNSSVINFTVPSGAINSATLLGDTGNAYSNATIVDTGANINAGLADLITNISKISSIDASDSTLIVLTLAQFSSLGTATALTNALAAGTIAIDSTSASVNDVNALTTNISKIALNGITGGITLSNSQFGVLKNALNASATLTVTDTSLTATALIAMNAKSTPSVNAAAVLTITGTAANIALVAASTDIETAPNFAATVSGTTNSLTDLNSIDANTTGIITATCSDTMTNLAALTGVANLYTITVSDVGGIAVLATALSSLGAKTAGVVTVTNPVTITGSAVQMTAALVATESLVIAASASVTINDASGTIAATVLSDIGAKTAGVVTVTNPVTITGSAVQMTAALVVTESLVIAASASVTINDATTVTQANAIAAKTSSVIAATIGDGTASTLKNLTGTHAYTVIVTDATVSAADLLLIDMATSLPVTASAITTLSGSAANVTAAYNATTTITGLGNEIVTLSDSGSIVATVLNSVDSKTSGLVSASNITTITGAEANVKTALIAITTGIALSDAGLTGITLSDAITATTLDNVIFANTNATVTLANVLNNAITAANATVTSGKILKIDGSAIVTNTNALTFDGSLELDGKFSVTGGAGSDVMISGAGADTLIGGLGNDTITGSLGADALTGGGGNDKFIIAATDSLNTTLDTISDFAAGDILHLAIPIISTVASTSADFSTAVSFASTGVNSTFLAADIATAVAAQRLINANFWANVGDTIAVTLSGTSVAGSNVTYVVQNQASDSTYNPTADTVVTLLGTTIPSTLFELNSTIHTLSTGKDVITATTGADVVVVNTDVGIGGDAYYSSIALAADGDTITDFAFGIDTIKVIAVKVNTFSHLTNVVIGAGGADYATNVGLISMNGDTVYTDLGDIALNFITPNSPLSVVNLKAALQYDLTGTAAVDTITGGNLADTIAGGDGADIINAGEGDNYITGGAGADSIISGSGVDIIDGGAGADTIESGASADIILGEGGADSIIAGAGNDTITGGVEADEYVFSNYAINGLDLITDFTTASDKLSFRFVDTAIAIGGTAVTSAAQQAMTNHSVYVASVAGLSADLTTGSLITLIAADLTATTLTNVAVLLGERYSVAADQNAIFIFNSTITNASGNAYVYSFHNGSDTTLNAGDLVLIGLLTTATVAVIDCI